MKYLAVLKGKTLELLNRTLLRQDRLLHFIAGMAICLIGAIFFSLETSVIIALVIGLGKEIVDGFRYNGFDVVDFLATAFGAVFAFVCLYLR